MWTDDEGLLTYLLLTSLCGLYFKIIFMDGTNRLLLAMNRGMIRIGFESTRATR